MKNKGKIFSILIKLLIGALSFSFIFIKLKNVFHNENATVTLQNILTLNNISVFIACVALFPLNWGIESYKWKLITTQIESISFLTATKSVYSGVCLGNMAPGRATEFIAKVFYFKNENRPKITLLHFVNGLFQLSITILFGITSFLFFSKIYLLSQALVYTVFGVSAVLCLLFIIVLLKINYFLPFIETKILKRNHIENINFKFNISLLIKLFILSLIRYLVFIIQFLLLVKVFGCDTLSVDLISGICIYFLLTTVIPMFSFIEAAVRAAIGLVVFGGNDLNEFSVIFITTSLWLINIVFPSIIGYFLLLRLNFNFNFFKKKKK
ncbi:MAG: hypothetical protein JSU07_00490 [Bacteroidetes bacterium]|nr:hypothetical protein [Bacteroidota bacterium]